MLRQESNNCMYNYRALNFSLYTMLVCMFQISGYLQYQRLVWQCGSIINGCMNLLRTDYTSLIFKHPSFFLGWRLEKHSGQNSEDPVRFHIIPLNIRSWSWHDPWFRQFLNKWYSWVSDILRVYLRDSPFMEKQVCTLLTANILLSQPFASLLCTFPSF